MFHLHPATGMPGIFNENAAFDPPVSIAIDPNIGADISQYVINHIQEQQAFTDRRGQRGSVTSGSYSSISELDSIQQQRSWRSIDFASLHRDTTVVSFGASDFASSSPHKTDSAGSRNRGWINDSSSCCSSTCSSASTLSSTSFSLSAAIPLPSDFGVPPLFGVGFGGQPRKRQRVDGPATLPPPPPLEEFSLGSGDPDGGRCVPRN